MCCWIEIPMSYKVAQYSDVIWGREAFVRKMPMCTSKQEVTVNSGHMEEECVKEQNGFLLLFFLF